VATHLSKHSVSNCLRSVALRSHFGRTAGNQARAGAISETAKSCSTLKKIDVTKRQDSSRGERTVILDVLITRRGRQMTTSGRVNCVQDLAACR
jgi:hypothetical protein